VTSQEGGGYVTGRGENDVTGGRGERMASQEMSSQEMTSQKISSQKMMSREMLSWEMIRGEGGCGK